MTCYSMFKLSCSSFLIVILFIIITCYCQPVRGSEQASRSRDVKGTSQGGTTAPDDGKSPSAIAKFKRLFAEHRVLQLNAVKSLQQFGDYSQRFKLLEIMLQQLFSVISKARTNLTEWGHLPGDPFPENETIQESVSKVFENTALFADLVLRLPDAVHELYDRQPNWRLTLAWALTFCNESLIFEGKSGTLLNLMAQEVNLIPKSPNYINPFKAEEIRKEQEKEKEMEAAKKQQGKLKKKKKKLERGPRLTPRTEL